MVGLDFIKSRAIGGLDAERVERDRQKQEEIDAQNRNFLAMKKMQEEGRAKRIAEYGEDVEPVFSDKLQGLHDSMMPKIQEIDDEDDQVPPGEPISSQNINQEEYEDTPSVRQIAHISTSGQALQFESISTNDLNDSVSDITSTMANSIPKTKNVLIETVSEEENEITASTIMEIEEEKNTKDESSVIEEIQVSVSEKDTIKTEIGDSLEKVNTPTDEIPVSVIPVSGNNLGKAKPLSVKVTRELLEKIEKE